MPDERKRDGRVSDEWRDAVAGLTEMDWAPYDDPETYADTMSADGTRL